MLATICVRLALGLILFLPFIWNCLPHPRFVRTQFISALGLLVVAVLSSWNESTGVMRGLLLAGCAAALAGAVSWTLDPAPGGRWLILATIAILGAAIFQGGAATDWPWRLFAGGVSSAALLGAALTSMLVGHSYLISPGLALTPLLRMLAALFVAAGLRAVVCGSALGFWLSERGGHTLTTEDALWLPVRWIVGIAAPVGFGAMALSAARIRSTQSATGILYVAVVCAILGELIGLLLETTHGWPL